MAETLQILRLILIGAFGTLSGMQWWLFWSRRRILDLRGAVLGTFVIAFIAARFMNAATQDPAGIYFWVQVQYASVLMIAVMFTRILWGGMPPPVPRWPVALGAYLIGLAIASFIPGVILSPVLVETMSQLDGPTPRITIAGWLLILPGVVGFVVSAAHMFRMRARTDNATLFGVLGPVGGVLALAAVNDMLRTVGVPTVAVLDFAVAALGFVFVGLMGRTTEEIFVALEQDVETRTRDLAQTTRGLRDLLNGLPDLVVLVREGRAEPFSEEARATWGSEPLRLRDLAATSRDSRELSELADLQVGEDVTMRLRLVGDKGTFPAEIMAVAVMFGGERAVVASARDLSEREEIERRLRLNDRLASVGTLAAGVAHEINNPMTYVSSNIAYVREWLDELDGEEVQECREALDDASKGASRVAAIVRELRHFGRPDESPSENASVESVVEFAIRLVEPTLRNRCTLENDVGDNLPLVRGDEGRITQVIVNLLTNAADAMPPSRSSSDNRIKIRSVIEQNSVEVFVEDNGRGMSPDQLEHVFDPFFTTKSQGAGMGLGLSICHRIASELGASMRISSEEDHGTRVTLVLPRQLSIPPLARETIVTPSMGFRPLDVLIVEDEPSVLKVLERDIGAYCRVTGVGSAQEAIDLLKGGGSFDAVICDLMMPEMGGREFHGWLVENRPGLAERTTIVTAGAVGDTNVSFLRESGLPIVDKPLSRAAIRSVLDSARPLNR